MFQRYFLVAVVCFSWITGAAAQTVRFDTNVGTFDMELNPTGNPNLQAHVDNLLAYVNSGRYDLTVINRAVPDFVLQMGGFEANSLSLPNAFSDFPSVSAFDPVIVDADNDGLVDFDLTGLNNTDTTVSLALSNNANTGTSSFFVNLGANASLDVDNLRFVPFARIRNMATIDLIMSLDQHNFDDGSLAGDNVPILPQNRIVFVERAFVVDDTPAAAVAAAAASSSSASSSGVSAAALAAPVIAALGTVPEPTTLVLAAAGLLASFSMRNRRAC